MSDVTDPRSWVERAEEDLAMARSALRRKRPLTSSACFHAQQCAEKYLKAILIAEGRSFPKTHDLVQLHTLGAQAGVLAPFELQDLSMLSDHAVRTRYPGEEPTVDEAREALGTARAVRRFARQLLGVR
jgi:HEPN domain-containing protein